MEKINCGDRVTFELSGKETKGIVTSCHYHNDTYNVCFSIIDFMLNTITSGHIILERGLLNKDPNPEVSDTTDDAMKTKS